MSQTSYNLETEVAVSGQLAFNSNDVTTFTYNNPVDVIEFGRMVAKVSGDDDGAELPDSAAAVLIGVAVRDLANVDGNYPAESDLAVLKRGQIYVEVEEAVTPDSDVFVRHTSGGGGSELGIFRTDDDTATAVQVTNAKFMTSAAAGGFAVLDLNLD